MKEYHKIATVWERDPETKHKTLIENAWAHPAFEYLCENEWQFTEKVDGTNIRVMWDGPGTAVKLGGKTDNAQLHAGLVEVLQEWFTEEEFSKVFSGGPVCLYGEGYGSKIQKGGGNYKADGQSFVLFDVWVAGVWLDRHNVEDIAEKMVPTAQPMAPVRAEGTLHRAIAIVRDAHYFPSAWGDFEAEGYVLRPKINLLDRFGRRVIAKIKRKDFLR